MSVDPFHLEYEKLLDEGHFYALETGKSEDLAAFAHFFLTVTPYGQSKRDWQKDLGGQTAKPEPKQDQPKDSDRDKSPKAAPAKPKDPKADDDKKSVSGKSDKSKVDSKPADTKPAPGKPADSKPPSKNK